VQELPEARDDEERVVDPDAEPDHRYEEWRDRVDVGEAGQNEEQEERGHQRAECERDRERDGHEGAEDDDQHEERREQAEQLLRPLLDGRKLGVAVELGFHAGRLDCSADRVLNGEDSLPILVVDDPIELGFRVGDAPIVGNGVLAEGIAHALDARFVLGWLEFWRLEARDRLLDRRLAFRGV